MTAVRCEGRDELVGMGRESASGNHGLLAQRLGNGMPSAQRGGSCLPLCFSCTQPLCSASEAHSCLIFEGGGRTSALMGKH